MRHDRKYDLIDTDTKVLVNIDQDAEPPITPLTWVGAVSLQERYSALTGRQATIRLHGVAAPEAEIAEWNLILAARPSSARVVTR